MFKGLCKMLGEKFIIDEDGRVKFPKGLDLRKIDILELGRTIYRKTKRVSVRKMENGLLINDVFYPY